jgi:hypothetical protein
VSVWFGAYQAVNELRHEVIGLRNDTRFRQGTRWISLEGLARSAFGAAQILDGMPDTEAFVAKLRAMGKRYAEQNSLVDDEMDADIGRLKPISVELFRRVHEGHG